MEREVILEDIKQESDTRLALYKDPLASVLSMCLMVEGRSIETNQKSQKSILGNLVLQWLLIQSN